MLAPEPTGKDGRLLTEARRLLHLGKVKCEQGDFLGAVDTYEQCRKCGERIKDTRRSRQVEGTALGAISCLFKDLGMHERAIEYGQQGLAIAREISDRKGELSRLGNLGIAYHGAGQYERAIEHHTQALAMAREDGERWMEGSILGNLGSAYERLGQYERAIEHFKPALAIVREVGG